ncbi:O-antigen ligase family protein [Pseudonocardia parietis]|uniref:O-antigen ligase n=1 Tax=Pseudonocardia parietis TaxID=570936 RepID=A0ABS4VR01_9PSEU|nr:O-antigen ligase family protein [Pseudonocardia parietis]MBP2366342.1 O-antigen ligase [Pseudonocardia parietis]
MIPAPRAGEARGTTFSGGEYLLLAVIALVALAVVGTVAGWQWALLLPIAFAGSVLVVLAVLRPVVAAAGLVLVEVTNLSGVVGDVGPVSIFQAALLVGLLSLAYSLRRRSARRGMAAVPMACAGLLVVYVLGQIPGHLDSLDPASSAEGMTRLVLDTVYLVVLLLLARASGRPWLTAAVVVAALSALSGLTLINQVLLDNASDLGGFATVTTADGVMTTTARHAGPLTDSNFWGRHLVMALPFALALVHRAWTANRATSLLAWTAATGMIGIGMYLTQSRGTLLTAGIAFVVWVVAAGPQVRRGAVLALPMVAPLVLLPGIGDRVVDMLRDLTAVERFGVDPSILGRQSAQEVAWAIFGDHRLFGVGIDVYPSLVDRYAGRVGTAVLTPTDGAHNLYAQLAAESGLVGLVAWLVMVGGFAVLAVASTIRLAGTASRGVGGTPTRSLAAAGLAGLVGWSAASVFLHLSYYRTVGLVLVMIGLVASMVLDGRGGRVDVPQAVPAAIRGLRRGLAYGGLCGAAGVVAALLVVVAGSPATYVARQDFTLQPSAAVEQAYLGSYARDVRSRDAVMPTYALILQGGRPDVSTEADAVRGTIAVLATGENPTGAFLALEEAVAEGRQRLAATGADRSFDAVLMSEPTLSAERRTGTGLVLVAVLIGSAMAVLILVVLRRARFLGWGPARRDEPGRIPVHA